MISKKYKLNLRKILNFFQNSRRLYSDLFVVFYRFNKEPQSQVVVVVPKKNVKLRVKRSQIKRLIYESVLPFVKESQGLELVLVANKKILTADRKEIDIEFRRIFSKLGYSKQR